MQKKIYVVLGMSRTGTSAVARSLIALGIDLGDYCIPGNELNPKGFWEDNDILHKINRGVSFAINYNYLLMNNNNETDIDADPVLFHYKNNAIKLLQNRLANTDCWGFKDPRTVTLIPFWRHVFKALDVDDNYIITLRNPLAAAHSNQKFIHCDLEEAILIWIDQMVAAIEGTHDKKRIIISYEAMLQNPRLQLQRMLVGLNVPRILNEEAVSSYTETFLDKNLSHHNYSDNEFYQHSLANFAPLCIRIYNLLKLIATDTLRFEDPEFVREWAEIKKEHKKNYALHRYIDSLVKRNKQLKKEILRIRESLLWKMTLPFWAAGDYLRNRRRRRKEEQRLLGLSRNLVLGNARNPRTSSI